MWKYIYHENSRFDILHMAIRYRDERGLAWSHYPHWDGRGWRLYPHIDRLNAWQRSHYTDLK